MEPYIREDKLIQEDEWTALVEILKNSNNSSSIPELLKNAVRSRLPKEPFGIFFSGGIDSVLIAKICKDLNKNFTCYTAGFYDKEQKYPEDLEWAENVAEELGFKLVKIVLDLKAAEQVIKTTVKILGRELDNAVNVGVGSVFVAVLEKAEEKHFFSGLGSEEIFAGYERHEKAKDINKECISGLKSMYQRDFLRDFTISKHYNVSFMTPFLDRDLITVALKVPAEMKLDKDYKKIILRHAAEKMGIPKHIAWRKKRAAQYGSRMDRALSKLAKKAGYKLKKEYIAHIQ